MEPKGEHNTSQFAHFTYCNCMHCRLNVYFNASVCMNINVCYYMSSAKSGHRVGETLLHCSWANDVIVHICHLGIDALCRTRIFSRHSG